MEDNKVSDEELLVARNNKRYVDRYDICQRIKNQTEI